MAFMGPCESMGNHPTHGYQRIGAATEPVDANPIVLRFAGIDETKVKPGSIFVPVLRNLRLYEPRNTRIGYEWLERVPKEGGLCLSVVMGGNLFSGRPLIDVDLTDHAEFIYE